MNIGIIDADGHNFPNLALMKISSYHRSHGDSVEWWSDEGSYDRVYISKVFSETYSPDVTTPQNAREVIRGGTGYAIALKDGIEIYDKENDKPLPYQIEHTYPDYSLYPQYTGYGQPLKKQTAYGYLTRGCPRRCDFCHVSPKEGMNSHKVADLNEFWHGQGHICLSDPNILACSQCEDLFSQLIESGGKVDFNQGLDARLITKEKAELLASMRLDMPHFALDNMKDKDNVARGIRLYVAAAKKVQKKWSWRHARVFVLTNFDTTFEEDMERIKLIQKCECWPYVMIYNKPTAPPITRRLQRWTNNPICYAASSDFYDYQRFKYKDVIYG